MTTRITLEEEDIKKAVAYWLTNEKSDVIQGAGRDQVDDEEVVISASTSGDKVTICASVEFDD